MSGTIPGRFEAGLVSVVVPVFDGARWLAEAIGSVRAQSYRPLEIIAVDDGSRDESARILRRFPDVRTIRQRNQGCTVTRNRGIAASTGEFIAFIDQDDRWLPDKLERQVALLRARPDVGYVLGGQILFLEPGCPLPAWIGSRHELFERPHTGYLPGTMLVRRSTMERIGPFDERFRIGSDSDWLVRARDAGERMVAVPELVIEKRIHESNLSAAPGDTGRIAETEILQTLAESLRRRRAGA